MTQKTAEDIRAFMEAHTIEGEILSLKVPTPTVATAAEAVGADPEQIVKSVLFLIHDEPVLAVGCGMRHIDRRSIAGYFQVGRKRVRLADAETVLRITGYPAGGVPPFGHHEPLKTLMDPAVLAFDEVFAGGGERNALIRVQPADILRVTGADVLPLLDGA
jgi:Cys-tRNA(Pro) deacylase